jgi:hypothetical protein
VIKIKIKKGLVIIDQSLFFRMNQVSFLKKIFIFANLKRHPSPPGADTDDMAFLNDQEGFKVFTGKKVRFNSLTWWM